MKIRPIPMTWTDDGHMVPDPRFAPLADKQFVVGIVYPMVPVEERSMKSHSHFFAAIHTAWENLPEQYVKRFPTEESLRAKALVATGFCTERDHVCDTDGKAKYLAGIIRRYSAYSIIKISGAVVKVFEPKSQAMTGANAMSGEEFKASKSAVLDWIQALNPDLPLAAIKKEAARIAPPEKAGITATKSSPNPPVDSHPVRPEGVVPPESEKLTSVPLNPKTAPEYFAFARAWIMGATSRDAAFARWDGERELRDKLRVSIDNRRQLSNLIENQFKETAG